MARKCKAYRLLEIPDPERYCRQHGHGILNDVEKAFTQLLDLIACGPEGAITCTLRYVMQPLTASENPQDRLGLYVILAAESNDALRCATTMVERGPISHIYTLEKVSNSDIPWGWLKAASHVIRRARLLSPLDSPEFNPHLPVDKYCLFDAFVPEAKNDYLHLDATLDGCEEPIVIDFTVTKGDTSSEAKTLHENCESLHLVNWPSHGKDSYDLCDPVFVGAENDASYARWSQSGDELRKDAQADEVLSQTRRFAQSLSLPQLNFNIRVLAATRQTADLLASVVAKSAFNDEAYTILGTDVVGPDIRRSIEAAKANEFVSVASMDEKIRDCSLYARVAGLAELATVGELAGLFRLPIGGVRSPRCMRMDTDPPALSEREMIPVGLDAESRVPRGIDLRHSSKPICILGVPGYAKTTAQINLAIELWRHGIPCLIIEPTKTEFRALKMLKNHSDPVVRDFAKKLRIYTLGHEGISPFRNNPLIRPTSISLSEHVQVVIGLLSAGMALPGPLLPIVTEALYKLFQESDREDGQPTMKDLLAVARRVVNGKGYTADVTANLSSALDSRFQPFLLGAPGKVFDCTKNTPSIPELVRYPCILELDVLGEEQVCLQTLDVLNGIQQYFKTLSYVGNQARYAVLIDEGHLIAGRESDTAPSEHFARPQAHTSSYFCRLIKECRALSILVVIADQFATSLASDVIKACPTKIVVNQGDNEERDILAPALNIRPSQENDLPRLRVGEAFFTTESYYWARKILLPNMKEDLGITIPPVREGVIPFIKDDPWYVDGQLKRVTPVFDSVNTELDGLTSLVESTLDELAALAQECSQLGGLKEGMPERRDSILRWAVERKKSLSIDFSAFADRGFGGLYDDHVVAVTNSDLIRVRTRLVDHLESHLQPLLASTQTSLNRLIDTLETARERNEA